MTTEEIIESITSFIAEIKASNNGDIIVLSLLPIRQTYPWESYYPVISKEIPIVNSKLKQFCDKKSIQFVDAYSHFADRNGIMREDLSDDGVHPNQEDGYKVLAGLINSALEKVDATECEKS